MEHFREEFLHVELLNELPRLIDPLTNYLLNKPSENARIYAKLAGNKFKQEVRRLSESVVLYRFRTHFFALHGEDRRVGYYMRYETDAKRIVRGSYVSQAIVWADQIYPETAHLAKDVFFEILLPEKETILTDDEQTQLGQNFWSGVVGRALAEGRYAYYVDLLAKQIVPLQKSTDFWRVIEDFDVYGPTRRHEPKRFAVAVHPLT
jgi:hypothetical protein